MFNCKSKHKNTENYSVFMQMKVCFSSFLNTPIVYYSIVRDSGLTKFTGEYSWTWTSDADDSRNLTQLLWTTRVGLTGRFAVCFNSRLIHLTLIASRAVIGVTGI